VYRRAGIPTFRSDIRDLIRRKATDAEETTTMLNDDKKLCDLVQTAPDNTMRGLTMQAIGQVTLTVFGYVPPKLLYLLSGRC
jgi:hypothetical protein